MSESLETLLSALPPAWPTDLLPDIKEALTRSPGSIPRRYQLGSGTC